MHPSQRADPIPPWCLQVEQFTNALQRQSVAEAEGAWEGSLPEAAEELADGMAAAALGRSSLSRQISVARDRPGSGETGPPELLGEVKKAPGHSKVLRHALAQNACAMQRAVAELI